MKQHLLLQTFAICLFLAACNDSSSSTIQTTPPESTAESSEAAGTGCPTFDFNPDLEVPDPALGLPCNALGNLDEQTGIGIYHYDVQDGSSEQYIVDQNKLLATIDFQYDEELKLAIVQPDLLYLMKTKYDGTTGCYTVNRKDGTVISMESKGQYWSSTPDYKSAVFTLRKVLTGEDPNELVEDSTVLVSHFNEEVDETYMFPENTSTSGAFWTTALSISPDGNRIALLAVDQIRTKSDESKTYGVLFLINRAEKTVKNVGSISEASHPLTAFSDSDPEDQFTWKGDRVTFTNGAQSVTSNN